ATVRPDDLAQLDARELDELSELAPVARERESERGEHQTPRHREPPHPGGIRGERVIARQPRDHDEDREAELHLVRRTGVLNLDFVRHINNQWQARRESNPQPAVLETAALPIELLAYSLNGMKLPAAISSDITPSAAGKKRGFCRLRITHEPSAAISANYLTTPHRRRAKGVTFARCALPAALRAAEKQAPPLLQNLRHHAGADGLAALANRKAQPLVHGDRADQLDRHLDVVPGHHHLHPGRQLDRARHVRGAKVKLRPVPLEERRVPPALLLRQHVHLALKV